MAEFQQRGEDLEINFAECKRLLEEAQGRLKELEEGRNVGEEDEEREAELKKVQAEVRKLKKNEKTFEKMIEEHRREEKKLPWNVDTISKEGFSKVRHGIKDTRCIKWKVTGQYPVLSFNCFLECTQRQACSEGGNGAGKGGEAQDLCGKVHEGNQTLWYALVWL